MRVRTRFLVLVASHVNSVRHVVWRVSERDWGAKRGLRELPLTLRKPEILKMEGVYSLANCKSIGQYWPMKYGRIVQAFMNGRPKLDTTPSTWLMLASVFPRDASPRTIETAWPTPGSSSSRVVDHLHGSQQPSSRAAQSHGGMDTRSQKLFARCGRIHLWFPSIYFISCSIIVRTLTGLTLPSAIETAVAVVQTTAHQSMGSVLVFVKGTFYVNAKGNFVFNVNGTPLVLFWVE